MHKLVHAWGQDRLEADRQRQLSSLALELVADATAQDEVDPSHQLRLVPSFGMFSPLHESLDELTMGRLAMLDGMEGFLSRIGRWSEASKIGVFHYEKNREDAGQRASIYDGEHEKSGIGDEQSRQLASETALERCFISFSSTFRLYLQS
jgi:hypothetical protein